MRYALLLSGGVGSRLPSEIPKQYIRVNGKMLITYSLKTLADSPKIDALAIVAADEWKEEILLDAERHHVSVDKLLGFSAPGANRQGSIVNGIQDILRRISGLSVLPDGTEMRGDEDAGAREADSVLIHDAARPLLSGRQIESCFAALNGHDGVMPALPMKDTVYLSRDGSAVSELLERDRLFAGQAPEVFRLMKYYRANRALGPEGLLKINGSTEPAVLAGMDIVMIPGDENNFKVTTQADLDRFRGIVCGKG